MNTERKLIKEKADNLFTQLLETVKENKKDKTKFLLNLLNNSNIKKYKEFNINTPIGLDGKQLITQAAEYGDEEMLEMIIDAGGDITLKNDCGQNMLEIILDRYTMSDEKELDDKKLKMAITLFNHGYDINARGRFGKTALLSVLYENDERLFNAVIKRNPLVNITDNSGESALKKAVCKDSLHKVKTLLNLGAKPDKGSKRSASELTCAAIHSDKKDSLEIAKLLINAGAKLNPTNRYEDSPLYYAREKGNKEFEQLLIDNGARSENYYKVKYSTIKFIADGIAERFNSLSKMVKHEIKIQKNISARKKENKREAKKKQQKAKLHKILNSNKALKHLENNGI